MASGDDIRNERVRKLEHIETQGELAYPASSKRTHLVQEALDGFAKLSKEEKEITLAGRVRAIRGHGGSMFLNIEDGSCMMQAYLKKDRVGEGAYNEFLATVDIGDIIQIRGVLFSTKKGEKTLEIASYIMLSKSLLPLPDKWHGLQDVDERYRKRYLDMLCNQDVRKKFALRSRIVKAVREFLEKEGFMEVETPILQPMYGGAEAEPFKTRLNAFDMDMYLRIAPELYLKRLIVGGFEKIYEIGRVFRNEGVDRMHNPDFTMLEFYWAYADYKDMMKLTERLFSHLLKKVFGTTKIAYEGKEMDFTPPWPRVEYAELFRKFVKLDIEALNRDALYQEAVKLKVPVDESFSKARIQDAIYKKCIRPFVWEPHFIIHYPIEMLPLAKRLDKDETKLGAFQLLAGGGWELVKAYSEQNNPVAQRKVFEEQEKLFRKGLEDAQRMDADFLEALEYGMPPTAGFGMGIDRLVTLLTDSHSLREVILFPTMKPKE